jgi:hypothetical protein
LRLQEIPLAEVLRIYEEQAKAKLPLSEKEFREVSSAEYTVFERRGLGGPQVAETTRGLANQYNILKLDFGWMNLHTEKISESHTDLNDRFKRI